MARIARIGREGEVAAGIVKNTTRIPSATGTAAYRVPDGLTKGLLTEVKNYSGTLRLTNQIKDFLVYAKNTKRTFELVVGKDTKFTKPLQELIDSGEIVLRRLE
ncbi:putative toxin [Pseudoxanthomonas winnipegensis]|uniref:Tox-REase-7 domain-containing protein n=1 Tax=Pseudoxanthomonas winnipegensis TaxID=2480810 RepID=A0A4Q8M3P5_9GAMM|nr:hypothetical protein EA655_11840 [Pseudoxanthomonas winnipegensis]